MKPFSTFLLAASLAAGFTYSGRVVNATGDAEAKRPLAASVTTASVDGLELNGEVVEDATGIYAVFTIANKTAQPVDTKVGYAVHCTPAQSRMSRMMSMPILRKDGELLVAAEPGATVTRRVLVQAAVKPAPPTAGTKVVQLPIDSMLLGKDVWTLTVSRGTPAVLANLGATLPSPAGGTVILKEGSLLLATTTLSAEPVAIQKQG